LLRTISGLNFLEEKIKRKRAMVYLYYGFFLFLLFMMVPVWAFGLIAAGSGVGLVTSAEIRRTLRTPVSGFRF